MSEDFPEGPNDQIDDGLGSGAPPEPQPEPPPVYVYAIAMMADGEVKLVTELPFVSVRKALISDVSMTASYVVSAIKDGKL